MRRHMLMFAALLLGACTAPAPEVATSGEPPGPQRAAVYAAGSAEVLALADTTPATTTVAPTTTVPPTTTTTHYHPPTTTTTAPPPATTQPTATAAAQPAPAGGLHPAIAAAFGTGALGHQAQRVAQCESELDAGAVSPTNDHGLFQINRPTWDKPHAWDGWQQQTGTSWGSVYDPYVNARFAAQLQARSGWGPWTCRHAA